jgi:site-specific recombinase XerD
MRQELVQAGLSKPKPDPLSLDELFDRWKIAKKPKQNSEAEYLRAKDLFKQLNTDKPIADYVTANARKFKDAILIKTAPNGEPLAHATRVKWFSSVKTLFKLADGDDLLIENPFEKITMEKPKRAKASKREDWEQDELEKLFGSAVYTAGKRPRGGAGEAAYDKVPIPVLVDALEKIAFDVVIPKWKP